MPLRSESKRDGMPRDDNRIDRDKHFFDNCFHCCHYHHCHPYHHDHHHHFHFLSGVSYQHEAHGHSHDHRHVHREHHCFSSLDYGCDHDYHCLVDVCHRHAHVLDHGQDRGHCHSRHHDRCRRSSKQSLS